MVRKIRRLFENFVSYYANILKSKNNFNISPFKALAMKIKGFTPDQYTLYNLEKNNIKDYVSEKERWYTRRINEQYTVVLDDKLIFYDVFKHHINIPENLFYIKNKVIRSLEGDELSLNNVQSIMANHESIFIKPIIGGGGRGVYKASFKSGHYLIDNKKVSNEEFENILLSSENSVANPAVEQSNFSNEFYPGSTNTIRLVTVYDEKKSKAVVTDALHRFGTSKTGTVDNASKGGIFANIDVDSGIMSGALNYYNESFDSHPDTNTKIKGTRIPGWDKIKKECTDVATIFSYIPYMAWDILITDNGISIIEINATSDMLLLQMFEGKKNTDLGEFFKSKGCIK